MIPSDSTLLSELAHAKAHFQLRTIAAVIGAPMPEPSLCASIAPEPAAPVVPEQGRGGGACERWSLCHHAKAITTDRGFKIHRCDLTQASPAMCTAAYLRGAR